MGTPPPRPAPRRSVSGGQVVMGLLIVAATTSAWIAISTATHPAVTSAASSSAPAVRSGPAPIGKEPFDSYRRAEEPQMFARWGASGLVRINRLKIAAAEKVANNPSCDEVQLADLADDLSNARKTPVVYVDCTNTQRFYVTEPDLARPLMSETQKGARWSEADAIGACTEAVRARLNIPTSLARDLFDTAAFQAATTGRWVVDFGFKARTGLGLRTPATAHCVLMTDGRPDLRIRSQ